MSQVARRVAKAAALLLLGGASILAVQAPASAATGGTAAGTAAVVNKPTDNGGPRLLSCSHAHPDKDRRAYGTLFDGAGVNIRPGPHTNCNPSLGLGQRSHRVDYHCFTAGTVVNGYTTWTYLRDVTTGVSGWVSDAFLDLNSNNTRGSTVAC